MSVIGAGTQIAMGEESSHQNSPLNVAKSEMGRQFGHLGTEMIKRNLNIQPTLRGRINMRNQLENDAEESIAKKLDLPSNLSNVIKQECLLLINIISEYKINAYLRDALKTREFHIGAWNDATKHFIEITEHIRFHHDFKPSLANAPHQMLQNHEFFVLIATFVLLHAINIFDYIEEGELIEAAHLPLDFACTVILATIFIALIICRIINSKLSPEDYEQIFSALSVDEIKNIIKINKD